MGRAQRLGLLAGLLLAAGCDPERADAPDAEPPPVNRFDAATAGALAGTVTWDGEPPNVPALHARINLSLDGLTHLPLTRPNPNAPHVDPETHCVTGAVIFLRGVDPTRARPWDHAEAEVELRDFGLRVLQGQVRSPVGFVRRGDAVAVVSREPVFHSLQARGAAFFGLTLPEPGQVRRRRLPDNGLVELTSGAGFYWMRGYLFVDDHPYYTRTDARGRFILPQVPPGTYELVCWLPNWKEARHERDPETGLVTRLAFGPPLEQVRRVTVPAGGTLDPVRFHVSARDAR